MRGKLLSQIVFIIPSSITGDTTLTAQRYKSVKVPFHARLVQHFSLYVYSKNNFFLSHSPTFLFPLVSLFRLFLSRSPSRQQLNVASQVTFETSLERQLILHKCTQYSYITLHYCGVSCSVRRRRRRLRQGATCRKDYYTLFRLAPQISRFPSAP